MKRYTLFLLIAAILLGGFWSCDPEQAPDPDPTEQPDKDKDPDPEPNPDPEPDPDPEPEVKGYVERPQTLKENSDWRYVEHRGTTYRTKQEVRNYEACYDTRRHNPMWVAFPCHSIYQEGGSTRPNVDPFRPDPDIPESEQSRIYADDWNNWPNNTSFFWSGLPDGTYTTRGHLLGSADRGAGRKDVLFDLNVQTFYATNVAPEAYLNDLGDGNYTSSHWGLVERLRQDSWTCSDTLYIVIGCDYQQGWTVNDNVRGKNVYEGSKECAMPSARYLVALRTKAGNSGKPIWKCSADEVMAIGFWFPQRFYETKITELPPLADYIYSVSAIERKIGGDFSFFPLAPEEVKDSYSISDWPGLSAIAGTPSKPSDDGLSTEDFASGGTVSW